MRGDEFKLGPDPPATVEPPPMQKSETQNCNLTAPASAPESLPADKLENVDEAAPKPPIVEVATVTEVSKECADSTPRPTSAKRSNYFVRHWRGQLPLGVSYWVNGFLVNILLTLLASMAGSLQETASLKAISVFFILFYIACFLISFWQIVGTWRSAVNYTQRGRSKTWATLAQVSLILSTLKVASFTFTTVLPQTAEFWNILSGDKGIPPYEIIVLPGGLEVEFIGGMRAGSSQALDHVLKVNPRTKTLRIDSIGGRIQEATRMARLVRERGLTTYAEHCASAATLVFIAGKERVLADGAELGFHAGTFPGLTPQQRRSTDQRVRKEMITSGIAVNFIDHVLATPNDSMWYPSVEEMRLAGVITKEDAPAN